jgi:hypothetical protein
MRVVGRPGVTRFLVAGLAAALLQACGGGGSATPQAEGLILDRTALSLVAQEGQTIVPQTIAASINNLAETATIVLAYTTHGIVAARFDALSPSTGQLVITPAAPASLAPGMYDDSIIVTACHDQGCTRQVTGSPKTVTFSYTVQAPTAP